MSLQGVLKESRFLLSILASYGLMPDLLERLTRMIRTVLAPYRIAYRPGPPLNLEVGEPVYLFQPGYLHTSARGGIRIGRVGQGFGTTLFQVNVPSMCRGLRLMKPWKVINETKSPYQDFTPDKRMNVSESSAR
jgi:hypothetical protein